MPILKTFDIAHTRFPLFPKHVKREYDYLLALEETELVTPIAHPTQASNWTGFQIHHPKHIQVAVRTPTAEQYADPHNWQIPTAARKFSPNNPGYKVFDGNKWVQVEKPQFQEASVIRKGMSSWAGPIQFHLKLQPAAKFKELIFGYEIYLDLFSYIAKTALPNLLKTQVTVVRTDTWVDKGKTKMPNGFDPTLVQEYQIKPLDTPSAAAILVGGDIFASGLAGAAAPHPATLHLKLTPHVEYARGLYQVEKVPCAVVRFREMTNVYGGTLQETVLVDENQSTSDQLLMGHDIIFDIATMADREEDARAIAAQLMGHLTQRGHIYVPPFDLAFGLHFVGGLGRRSGSVVPLNLQGGMGAGDVADTIGGLPTATFQVAIKRAFVSA